MASKMCVLGLLMLACVIQSGYALKCFTCDSISNRHCADLSDKAFQPHECVAENILSQGAGFISQLGLGGNSNNANKEPLIPTCLKVVTRNNTVGMVVARRCAVKYQNQDPCAMAKSASQQTGVTTQFEFCGACDVDACNSGNSMQLFYALTVFAAIVSTARLFV